VWWYIYIALHSKFLTESDSERIFKIGYDLTKLLPKVWWLPSFGTQCTTVQDRVTSGDLMADLIYRPDYRRTK